MSLTGVNTPTYSFLADDLTDVVAADQDGFRYDPTTFTATWILDGPIDIDKLLLDISGQGSDTRPVQGATGGVLLNDGVDFEQNFSVLPGDTNRDTAVSVTDLVNISSRIQFGTFKSLYGSFFDLNGDGAISVTDIVNAVRRVPSFLPMGMPVDTDPPAPTSALSSDTAFSAVDRQLLASLSISSGTHLVNTVPAKKSLMDIFDNPSANPRFVLEPFENV